MNLGDRVQAERQQAGLTSTKGAALSLVVARAGTSYDIARRYAERFGSISACSERNVRTILSRLENERLVERVSPVAAFETTAVQLRATPAGLAVHRAWMAAPIELGGGALLGVIEPSVPRRDILVRVLAATVDDREIVATLLAAYEDALLRMVDQGARLLLDGLAGTLIREERELMIQSQLQWVERAREHLASGGPGP